MPDESAKVAAAVPAGLGRQRRLRDRFQQPRDVLAAVAIGGALGALARYGIQLTWPTPKGGFPMSTLTINFVGCAAIGVLMVLITEVWAAHPLVRPFIGTGVLGGFTTFSTYAVETERLVTGGAARTGLLYMAVTPVAALISVWLAVGMTRIAVRRGRHETDRQSTAAHRVHR